MLAPFTGVLPGICRGAVGKLRPKTNQIVSCIKVNEISTEDVLDWKPHLSIQAPLGCCKGEIECDSKKVHHRKEFMPINVKTEGHPWKNYTKVSHHEKSCHEVMRSCGRWHSFTSNMPAPEFHRPKLAGDKNNDLMKLTVGPNPVKC